MRSLWTARDALSNVVEIREQWPELDFVDTCRITNAHKSSHETEKPPAHVGAPAIQKDLDRFRTEAQNVGDFHVTRYVFHRRLLAECSAPATAIVTPNVHAHRRAPMAVDGARRSRARPCAACC
jgi:hypothetical protein